MKITDIRCATLGSYPVVRVVTNEGIDGFGPVESFKPFIAPFVAYLREALLGADPCLVERTLLRIRQRGASKPWGAAVSAIEIALWDIAGKAAGLPIHRLLGGKVRDRVRVYNGALRKPLAGYSPDDYAAAVRWMKSLEQGFTVIKQSIGFHSPMRHAIPDFHYGEPRPASFHGWPERGTLREHAFEHIVDCAAAMKRELGSTVALALDCGPGMVPSDAIRLARALEPLNLIWLEDMLTGDYSTHVDVDAYRDVSRATSTPIHTGEQIYLRGNFMRLIETRAVSVIGPDPCDIGGLAELKWVAEHADLHGIAIAPHGTADGLLGLAALVQVCAALPDNFIAFELPWPKEDWWFDIVEGIDRSVVRDGFVDVWDRPGLGVRISPEKARKHLAAGSEDFFD